MGLTTYKKKRDFTQTSEPAGKSHRAPKKTRKALKFVIHKHAARRLHFDLRLEMEGVLKSWAVPKGLPIKKGERHLAVHVEDHPFEYGSFEGNIPEGNYGAGSVMLWDEGTYEVLHGSPIESLHNGKIVFYLRGQKLKGEWLLVRTKMKGSTDEKESWLVIKGENDCYIDPKITDLSVTSERSMEEIRTQSKKIWQSNRENKTNTKKVLSPPKSSTVYPKELELQPASKPAYVEPMKAQLTTDIPQREDWVYEIKLDGIRAIAVKSKGKAQLFSRSHRELGPDHPEIVSALENLKEDNFVLDGEIVALSKSGHSSFQLLQRIKMNGAAAPIFYYCFDLLNLNSRSLLKVPLNVRKKYLLEAFSDARDPIRLLDTVESDADAMWKEVKRLGLEGIVAKRNHSFYQPGFRSNNWKKIKVQNEQEFVIGGYTPPKGSRTLIGALLLGYYENNKLVFSSKVGTGFDVLKLRQLHQEFQKYKSDQCPFINLPIKKRNRFGAGFPVSLMKECTWLKPNLVCRVRFMEWTEDGGLRHPVFVGLREDIDPREVKKDQPIQ